MRYRRSSQPREKMLKSTACGSPHDVDQVGFWVSPDRSRKSVTYRDATPVTRLLAPDDAADLIQESPQRDREFLLELLDDMTRQDARALLASREDVAGGLMNPRFARLRPLTKR